MKIRRRDLLAGAAVTPAAAAIGVNIEFDSKTPLSAFKHLIPGMFDHQRGALAEASMISDADEPRFFDAADKLMAIAVPASLHFDPVKGWSRVG